jgi:putative membrane protein
MSILLNWLISTIAIIISAYILPGIKVPNFSTALVAALVLGILNAVIRPLLLLLTLPVNILTLGLFTLVINAVIILLVSSLVPEFQVNGFLSALLFAIVLSVINSLLINLA